MDPHLQHRAVVHRHAAASGVGGSFAVPVAAFKLAHGSARIDTPPPTLGQDTDAVLTEAGYGETEIAELRKSGVL
jgi:crotonobetainyl-CoA:carnitine CoA-transferase CaiB-like acyl-CoA transferase